MPDKPPPTDLDTPFRSLWPSDRKKWGRLGTATINRLGRHGVKTVRDLTKMTPLDVTDIQGAGPSALDEVRRVLAACGLSLRDDRESVTEAETEARVRRLMNAGLRRAQAQRFALEQWPKGEIAPGVTLEVSE